MKVAIASLSPHAMSNVVPAMTELEFQALKDDIAEHGVLAEVVVSRDGRRVLDGRHRLRAARELGMAEIPATLADLDPEEEAAYVLRMALVRRHLSDDQRAVLGALLIQEVAAQSRRDRAQGAANARWHARGTLVASEHGTPRPPRGRVRETLAETFGVSVRKVRSAQRLLEGDNGLCAEVLAGRLRLVEAEARLERQGQLAAIRLLPDLAPDERGQIWTGDFRDLGSRLADASVDLVLTDPPYGEQGLHLWEDLGRLAARVLKPSGYLITYAGHLFLPKVLADLERSLAYEWLDILLYRGAKPSIPGFQVRSGFRPILIFLKPPAGRRPFRFDVVTEDSAPDKRFHEWGQSEPPARYYVSHFAPPGGLVFDPMTGAGTFPVAAVLEGRRAIGIELDAAHAETARRRLAEALSGKPAQSPQQADSDDAAAG